MKKSMFVLLIICLTATTAFAGPNPTEAIASLQQISADTPQELTRLMLDLHLSYFERNALRLMDMRVSPMIVTESHFEVPVEMGFMLTEDRILTALAAFEESSGGKMIASPRAITVSVSAESMPDGKPLLSMTVLVTLHNNVKTGYDSSLKLAFEAFAKVTTFSPQIGKNAEAAGQKTDTASDGNGTWVTNLRIDSDRRLQLTGYAIEPRMVNQFCRDFEKTGVFSEMTLSSMNRNMYNKQPVMRFDVTGKVAAGN
ncbi:MAG: PilN domain-containing protein [Candidatus Riflebacteria bacterium]|nr:PilN domain-containing protein [Candidatus Riflebacteria bacterium]